MRPGMKISSAVAVCLAGMMVPHVAHADQNEAVAVAIWFVEADGSTKPYYFHDLNNPLPRWSCEARLDYLTKQFYRMTRSNPDLKDKQAVKSGCVAVSAIDQD
jgi:hypothetical protein